MEKGEGGVGGGRGPGPGLGDLPYGPENLPYDAIGGEAGVRGLVERFYDRMEEGYPALRAMHPADDRESREKLFEFLSGWLGGPPLYMEKRGHPRLRMRHAPFAIDEAAVEAWLGCMEEAIEGEGIGEPLRGFLMQRFTHTARFMRNR